MPSFGRKLGKKTLSGAKQVASAAVPTWFKGVIVIATLFLVLAVFIAVWKPTRGLVMPLVRPDAETREDFVGGCGAGVCATPTH